MRNLFKTVVSNSPLNAMPSPPTQATLQAWHRKALLSTIGSFSALGIIAIGTMVGSAHLDPATSTSTIMPLMALMAGVFVVLAISAEISQKIVALTKLLSGDGCERMLALCASESEARAYQKAVLDQGRAFHRLDLALVERRFLAKRHKQACRELHGLVG